MSAFISCMTKAAEQFDDHQSDAATIAKAIKDACPAEFERSKKEHGATLGPQAYQAYSEWLDQKLEEAALAIVLKERRASQSHSN